MEKQSIYTSLRPVYFFVDKVCRIDIIEPEAETKSEERSSEETKVETRDTEPEAGGKDRGK